MLNTTRILFDAYVSRIAELNGVPVDHVLKAFSVNPSVAQALYEVMQASSDFMSRINLVQVVQQSGEKVGVGITGTIAGRTNTAAGNRRMPNDPTDTTARDYFCAQTNFDTKLRYAKLDAWRHKPEFQTMIRDLIVKAIGLDRMMIGWNGTSIAVQTDKVANPFLQDVNIGWIQHLRTETPEQIMAHGHLDTAKIYLDVAGYAAGTADYPNLDALVFDGIELLGETHRDGTDLVAILGRDLVHDKYFDIVTAAGDKATEQLARDVLLSQKKVGGLPAVRVPKFPAGKLAITSLDNLSVYLQEGTERRSIIDEPQYDQVANYQSVNEAYVVEDNSKMVVLENIQLGAKPKP